MILLASAPEMSAPDIARLYLTGASHVRMGEESTSTGSVAGERCRLAQPKLTI
jgi:hypothetical protein